MEAQNLWCKKCKHDKLDYEQAPCFTCATLRETRPPTHFESTAESLIKCPFCAESWCYKAWVGAMVHDPASSCNLKNQQMPLITLKKLVEMAG